MNSGTAKRSYRMTARAEGVRATGERILDATEALFWSGPVDRMSLDAVAARAGVTVQTVLRRYGSKDGLWRRLPRARPSEFVVSVTRRPSATSPAPWPTCSTTTRRWASAALRLLAEEDGSPAMGEIAESGRDLHRRWVRAHVRAAARGLPRRGARAQAGSDSSP